MPIGSVGFHRSRASATATTTSADGSRKRRTAVTVRPYSNIGGRHADVRGDPPHSKYAGAGSVGRGANSPCACALVLPPAPRWGRGYLRIDRGTDEWRRTAVRGRGG